MKRTLVVLAVALLTFASAVADVITIDDINYKITSDEEQTVSVTSGGVYVGDVVVPSAVQIDGKVYTVTSTEGYAFNNCTDLITVTLPTTLKELGQYTFNRCSNLEQVNVPDGVTSIPFGCFFGAGLTSMTLPASVSSIGSYAFAYTSKLADINITDAITDLGEAAFCGSGITNVTIPTGITSIPKFAFSICNQLESVTLHDGITDIGDNAFAADPLLTAISLPESVTSLGASAFATCQSLQEIVVPDGVNAIPNKCFYSCTGLKRTVFGKGVKSIGEEAFTKYKNITASFQLKELVLKSESMVSGGANFDEEIYGKTTVYVPETLVEAYKADADWGKFTIAAIDESADITTATDHRTDNGAWYNLNGTKATSHKHGTFVHNGKTVVVK